MSTVWFDVTKVLVSKRVSGIERVTLRLAQELNSQSSVAVKYFRFHQGKFLQVSLDSLPVASGSSEVMASTQRSFGKTPRWVSLFLPLIRFVKGLLSFMALMAWKSAFKNTKIAIASILSALKLSFSRYRPPFEFGDAPVPFESHDIVICAGSNWDQPGLDQSLLAFKNKFSLKLVYFVHDVIPWKFPHFFGPGLSESFVRWLGDALSIADQIITISKNSKSDIIEFAKSIGAEIPNIGIVREGDDFCKSALKPEPVTGLSPNAFALCVGTIEVRKNPQLLYQIWRTICVQDVSKTPKLVLAGGPGWLTSDIIYQMKNDPIVKDRILIVSDINDAKLSWLYQNCLFSIYPSYYEGWGLPVGESLAHGKPCLISNASSLPEIAPGLAPAFDPNDVAPWVQAIKELLESPENLRRLGQRVKNEYKPYSWAITSRDILETIGAVKPIQNKQAVDAELS